MLLQESSQEALRKKNKRRQNITFTYLKKKKKAYRAYLIQLFKLHHLKEDVFEDVLSVLLFFIQLPRDPEDVSAFPHVKLQVVVGACTNHTRLFIIICQE